LFADALIIAPAIQSGCEVLYSEYLQHGRVIGELAITNPFVKTRLKPRRPMVNAALTLPCKLPVRTNPISNIFP
jgi:hypothetical protein